jgi:rubrerythrin
MKINMGGSLFEDFFSSESIDVAKGIQIGIWLEKKSINFYNEKSKNMLNSAAANLIKFIASEEVNHLEQLTALKETLAKKKGWVSAETLGKPQEPKLYEKGFEPKVDETSEDASILLAAARAEVEARDFYIKFSEKINDTIGKKFFERLAEFEQSHYDLFDGILEASQIKVEGGELLQ